jgi:hypothetical protein
LNEPSIQAHVLMVPADWVSDCLWVSWRCIVSGQEQSRDSLA